MKTPDPERTGRRLPGAGLLLLGAACLPRILIAQDLPYESGSTGADGPLEITLNSANRIPERTSHSAAWDGINQRVMAFGGYYYNNFPSSPSIVDFSDTRAWTGDGWVGMSAPAVSSGLYENAMAFDASRGIVVLHGGTNRFNNSSQETWTWDGSAWTRLSTSSPIGHRRHHTMAYDATNEEIILFGGWNGSSATNQTWAFDGATWTNQAPATSPGIRYHHAMTWDAARQEIVVFGGYDGSQALGDTWVWDGTTWTERTPAASPPARYSHGMGYDPASQKILVFGGWVDGRPSGDTWSWDGSNWTEESTTRALSARNDPVLVTDEARGELLLIAGRDLDFGAQDDTWRWDANASDWVQVAGSRAMIDMSEKPDGVWNFTSITIPSGITVEFVRNDAGTPVVWLATDDVIINGNISVNGRPGTYRDNRPGLQAPGGPGGFAGGLGGTRVEVFNTTAGTPGQGPGGGAPGINTNQAGTSGGYQSVYGNPYVVPLIGGSGGGGGAAGSSNQDGGNGGGGGGAILIASSRDIEVNGLITANGGYYGRNASANGSVGGHGSGGAVKLVADRILGGGQIQARNGAGSTSGIAGGYVRLESYIKPFDISGTVLAGDRSNSAPVAGVTFANQPTLVVSQVAGAPVAQPPSGSFDSPDVIFSEPGEITITITATNIPDGTPVTVRVVTPTTTINLPGADPPVTLSGGTAVFTTTVPAGFGTIQAFATYDVDTDTL